MKTANGDRANGILAESIRKGGFDHEQIYRNGRVAVYARWTQGGIRERAHYETIIVGWQDSRMMGGRLIEAGEYYPGASSFGVSAWTYKTMTEAMARAMQCVENDANREEQKGEKL